MTRRSLVAWQLADGRRGHERQASGLLKALAARTDLVCHRVDVNAARHRPLREWLSGRYAAGDDLPSPDLIIGAGRRTHFALLAARRAHGGRAICLMRSQLPARWFDLNLVPRHDGAVDNANTIATEGMLNPMQRREHGAGQNLILLGGPSRHHDWATGAIVEQVRMLTASDRTQRWTLSTSPRTPSETTAAVSALTIENLQVKSFANTSPDWLESQLGVGVDAWVTADSVSMIYEALSAGSVVGIVDVPARRHDRISAIAADLKARGWVRSTAAPTAPTRAPVLDEAARCAEAILERWPELAAG